MTEWCLQHLTERHDLNRFDCGVPELNDWLRKQARRAEVSDVTRTWVLTKGTTSRVVLGYYSLIPTALERAQLTSSQAGGQARVPAMLLAKLAVDQSLQGRGFGKDLLIDAINRVVAASVDIAVRLIVVDAISPQATAFYQHHDFKPVKDEPQRLIMKVATARQGVSMAHLRVLCDEQSGLGSAEILRPDGSTVPMVVDGEKAAAFMAAVQEAEARWEANGRQGELNLRPIFMAAFGRDPFQEP